jgi:hypothetical protein
MSDQHRHGTPILVRADTAGCTREFLAHIRGLRGDAVSCEFCPHPGAQLDAFEEADGWRYTAFATDTPFGQLARLDARHRAHARVEDRIRCAKDTGLDHFPSRSFAINQAWLTVVMLRGGSDRHDPAPAPPRDLAKAEPKTLRYRLLHVAARLTRGQRQVWLRIQRSWPWARDLATAFSRLLALPVPAG